MLAHGCGGRHAAPHSHRGTNCAFGTLPQHIVGHDVHRDFGVQMNEPFIPASKVMRCAQILAKLRLSQPQIGRVTKPKQVRVVTLVTSAEVQGRSVP